MYVNKRLRPQRLVPRSAWFARLAQVVLACGGLVWASNSARATEPNNTFETATVTGLSGFGSVTIENVTIGDGPWPDQDVDIYSFELYDIQIPALVTIEVNALGSDLDAFGRLFDASGTEFVNNDDRAFDDVNVHLRTYLLESGIHYVGVSASANPYYYGVRTSGVPGATGDYTLAVTVEPATLPDSPYEPNDTIGSAVDMGSGTFAVTGEFIGDGESGRQDVDIYWLRLSGAARLDIQVRAESIGSPLDAVVQTAGVLGVSDDAPDGSVDPVLSVGSPEPHDVYILVYGAGNPKYRSPLVDWEEPGSVGPYELTVTVTYLDDSGVGEPNDSIVMATHTSALPNPRDPTAPQVFQGFLGDGPYGQYRGDRDFYEVHAQESGVVTIDVAAASIGSEFDPVLVLYDRSGQLLGVNDNTADSTDARLTVPAFCPKPDFAGDVVGYVMVIGTKQQLPNDPFVPWRSTSGGISAERVEEYQVGDTSGSRGPYTLALSWTPAGDTCSQEPNETLATATDTGIVDEGFYLCADALIGDGPCRDPLDDVDIFAVEVLYAPARLRAVVAYCRDAYHPLSCSIIRMFDASGQEIVATEVGAACRQPQTLETWLHRPGRYYVGVAEYEYYDPLVPCKGPAEHEFLEEYQLLITLTRQRQESIPGTSADSADSGKSLDTGASIFATQLDGLANLISVVDADTGETTASFATPEPHVSGAEGLAYEGDRLFFVGIGRYPKLYELDPSSGEVLDGYRLWLGSGFYSDAVMFHGELFILDYADRAVHVLDPTGQRFLRTLPIRSTHGLTIGGGLAVLADPDLLYIADAFNTGLIYEVSTTDGALRGLMSPHANRPTALAGVGPSTLYVGDWRSDIVEIVGRDGDHMGDLELGFAPGALAGHSSAAVCSDVDADGICDFIDNCPDAHNVAQTDSDGDGAGDPCDGCVNDPDNDVDGDGVCGDVDSCAGYDDRLDQDGDAIPDDCDNCPNLANARQIDCDGDGRGDRCAITDCAPNDPECQDCNQNGVPDACDLNAWQTSQLNTANRFAAEAFGASVAVDNDAVAIVTPGVPRDWRRPGFAQVFRLDRDATALVEEAELISHPWSLLEEYVDSIAISGDRVIVGARGHPSEEISWPIVHSFRAVQDGSTWEEEARIVINEDASGGFFDMSTAVDEDLVVVGTPYSTDNGTESGAVRIFELTTLDEEARLLASDAMAFARFGGSVAADGALIAVGAPGHQAIATDAGSAYVFRRNPITENWEQEATLVAPDVGLGDGFGTSIAIDRNLAVVGSPGDDQHGTDTGAAYVFRYDENDGQWVYEAKLSTSDSTDEARLGHSVTINGDTVVVGGSYESARGDSTGPAYVFRFDAQSLAWIELAELEPRDGAMGRKFGWSVSVSGQTAIVGAPVDPDSCLESDGCESGLVYAFALPSYDCNANSIPDTCDAGDVDGNDSIDLFDYAEMHTCLTGPCTDSPCDPLLDLDRCCPIVDFDVDADVDLWDYAQFQIQFTNEASAEP